MKKLFTRFPLLAFLSVLSFSVSAQRNFWSVVSESSIPVGQNQREILPKRYQALALDTSGLKKELATAPKELSAEAKTSPLVLTVPMPNGSFARFKVVETSMMEPALAQEFPNIKTYGGQGVDDPYATIKLDWTELGFHGMIASPINGTVYIDPYAKGILTNYITYNKADVSPKTLFIEAGKMTTPEAVAKTKTLARTQAGKCIGQTLRTYRLAVACTGEYARAAVGPTVTVAQAISAITTTINRVNGVYEKEVDIRMILISNESKIVFTNPTTDSFKGNNDGSILINESQTMITKLIGSANFDIGHTFSTGGGGLAGQAVVCRDAAKARGITGLGYPVGDPYDIDYVAHEIGHQFGGSHTFNAATDNCGGGNGSNMTNDEPGSGVTIMAYAGICGSVNDLAQNSIPYFHAVSFDELTDYTILGDGNSCAVRTATGNNPPTVNAGADYTIPKSTPFVLTGTASDPDGDAVTYSWEQVNFGGPFGNWDAPVGNAPIFRSFVPSTNGVRYFPQITDIVNNTTTIGELLPTYGRTLNFRLTARDNKTGGGGVCSDEIAVAVEGGAGPFTVISPNNATTWQVGTFQTIVWDVAKTNEAPVNCANVTLELSFDGGRTYPTTLVASTPNDGSAEVLVPDNVTSKARVRVRSVGNIFFDISNVDFSIQKTAKSEFFLSSPEPKVICANTTSSSVINTNGVNGFNKPITFTVTGNPTGSNISISPNPVNPGGSTTVTMSGTIPEGIYTVNVTGTSDTIVKSTPIVFNVVSQAIAPAKYSPANNSTGAVLNATFKWKPVDGSQSYALEISKNPAFTSIEQSIDKISDTLYTLTTPLTQNTEYYWRIFANNPCGKGVTSTGFLFKTIAISCGDTARSKNVPVIIPDTIDTVYSTLNIPTGGTIIDLDVVGLKGTHTYVQDLTVSVISPQNTEVILFDQVCGEDNGFDINFDDEAASGVLPCPPVGGVTRQPYQPLSRFDNETSTGTWKLKIIDNYDVDGGVLTAWGLRICTYSVSTLPVNWLSFTGRKLENNTVELQWSTASEIKNDHYEIERSADGINFNTIGNMPAGYRAGATQQYIINDGRPFTGFNYYRLKQFDKDGHFSYSQIVKVVIDKAAGSKYVVYPNPAVNNSTVRILSDMKQLTLQLHDALGKVIHQKVVGAAKAGQEFAIPVKGLAKGLYIVSLTTENGTFTEKVMVQ